MGERTKADPSTHARHFISGASSVAQVATVVQIQNHSRDTIPPDSLTRTRTPRRGHTPESSITCSCCCMDFPEAFGSLAVVMISCSGCTPARGQVRSAREFGATGVHWAGGLGFSPCFPNRTATGAGWGRTRGQSSLVFFLNAKGRERLRRGRCCGLAGLLQLATASAIATETTTTA